MIQINSFEMLESYQIVASKCLESIVLFCTPVSDLRLCELVNDEAWLNRVLTGKQDDDSKKTKL